MLPLAVRSYVNLCTTYDSVAAAVSTLSPMSTLLLDCEGRRLARTTGLLSVMSISDVLASNIFLIDTLAMPDPSHPILKSLLDLLRSEDVTKLMWDGRGDALELRETYGVELRGVLDLQLVEVVSRKSAGEEMEGWQRRRLAVGYDKRLKGVKKHIERNPEKYEEIFQVHSMSSCLRERGIKDNQDAALTALLGGKGSGMWLQRPLPDTLQEKAAHDLKLMADLHDNFVHTGLINKRNRPLFKEQSERYLRTFRTRAVRELFDQRNLGIFVPMHVLEAPPAKAQLYECEGCKQELPLRHFPRLRGKTIQRLTFCKLCELLAMSNSEASMGHWVAV